MSGITSIETASQYQIYYRWHQESRKYLRRDNDQSLSATQLPDRLANVFRYQTFSLAHTLALDIYIEALMFSLT